MTCSASGEELSCIWVSVAISSIHLFIESILPLIKHLNRQRGVRICEGLTILRVARISKKSSAVDFVYLHLQLAKNVVANGLSHSNC